MSTIQNHDENVNARDNQGRTPLHLAAESGHVARVVLLLQKGAGVDVVDGSGRTPLLTACVVLYKQAGRKEHELVIEHLLNHGANINAKDLKGYTALHWAVNNGPLLQQLLSRGADINARDNEDHTALHWAAQSGRTSCVISLLEKGATVDAVNSAGDTSLLSACRGFHSSKDEKRLEEYQLVVEYLDDCGANINARGQKGYSTLHWAFHNEAMLGHLLDRNANVNHGDDEDCTPLHWAAQSGYASCVSLLLQRGATVDALNNIGDTPLLSACRGFYRSRDQKRLEEYQLIIDHLVNHGANINAQGQKHYSTLHWTTNEILMRHLLDRGASVDVRDRNGRSPLHWAAESGNACCVTLLLEKGAVVDAVDNAGATPLSLASHKAGGAPAEKRESYDLVIEMLLDRGASSKLMARK